MPSFVTAIIVTHDSENFLDNCLKKLFNQNYNIGQVIIVDSGSKDREYLMKYRDVPDIRLIFQNNIGFARANNIGFASRRGTADFILFLNPDAFLEHDFLEKAVEIMEREPSIALLSGRLAGFDHGRNEPNGKLDTTGIFRKAYGRWYDRGQGQEDCGQYLVEEEVPALCGAVLLGRASIFEELGNTVFDEDFFLYKEDIELSLRVRKYGWRLLYSPDLKAYHCRGWSKRKDISYEMKKIAAESEILLYKKHPSPYIIWALLKYLLVVCFRI